MKKASIRKAVYSSSQKDFAKHLFNALDAKLLERYNLTDSLIRRNIFNEADVSSMPDGKIATDVLQSKDAEIALDPNFEKEYFMDTMEYKGRYIVFKKIGLGMAKPIRVYIEDKPWEIFPTLKFAKKHVKLYIDAGRDKKTAAKEEEERRQVLKAMTPEPVEKPAEQPKKASEPKEDKGATGVNKQTEIVPEKDLGMVREFNGLRINVENQAGTERVGMGREGEWRTKMMYDYGFIVRQNGNDGEGLDVYLGPDPEAEYAYIVLQMNPFKEEHTFDEEKVMLGFHSSENAKEVYLAHYNREDFYGGMYQMRFTDFREIANSSKKTSVSWSVVAQPVDQLGKLTARRAGL